MANGASATADLAEETASSTRDEIAMLSMTREASGEDAGDATAEEGMVSVWGGRWLVTLGPLETQEPARQLIER